MRKSDKRHRIPAEHITAVMILQNKRGDQRTLDYETHIVQDDKAGDRARIVFSDPADIRGTALLRVEDPGARDDEQWLYLPAFRKTRRIGTAELGDRFVGSDLYYEDMKRRYVDDYGHKLLGKDSVDGKACYVIESVPTDAEVKKESPYGKSHIWLRTDNLAPVKIRLFDRKLRPLKEIHHSKLQRVAGAAWRAGHVEIVDIKRKHRTVVKIKSRTLPQSLPAATFSKHKLSTD